MAGILGGDNLDGGVTGKICWSARGFDGGGDF